MIKFVNCTQEKYNTTTPSAEALYFTSDTKHIYKGSGLYNVVQYVNTLPPSGLTGVLYYDEVSGKISIWNGTEFETKFQKNIPVEITNKQRMAQATTTDNGYIVVDYKPNVDIYFIDYTPTVTNTLSLSTTQFDQFQLTSGEVATYENWIKSTTDLTSYQISGLTLVNRIPDDGLPSNQTHVFTRRVYCDKTNTIREVISYSYSF